MSMSVRITYFVHGTSVDNERGISSGWKDTPLSELGVRQAEELKEKLKGRKFGLIFSSDLQRALRTAEVVFGKAAAVPDVRLRECNYGTYNGKPSAIVEPMQERTSERFPEGESYEDVKKRVADFLGFLKREYNGKHIALVSHKAPQLCLEVLLNGKTWEQASTDDWRKTGSWQAGWEYELPQYNIPTNWSL